MFAYALRRLLQTIPLFLVASFIIFWAITQLGDPLARLATCNTCDESAFERIRDIYELDKSIPERWFSWFTDVLRLEFGESTSESFLPVWPIIWDKVQNTIMLAVPALILTVMVATSLAVWSALRQYKPSDYLITSFAFLGIALPTFVLGLGLQALMLWVLSKWGFKPFFIQGKHNETWLELIQSLVLPIITLSMVTIGGESRFGRSAMLEVLHADYIRTARAKGLPERTVIFKHGLRNALVVFVTIWALDFAALLGGSVVTESVFQWPGLGRTLLDAIFSQDIDLAMAAIFFVSLLAIGFNLLADLLYGIIDPRIRYE